MDIERRDYLLSISEYEASHLPREDWYDRTRLLRRKLANETLERIEREVRVPLKEKTSPRARNDVIDVKKNWNDN